MDYDLALANVKFDRDSAISFIKQNLKNDDITKNAEHLSDETLAVMYADAYSRSEWGL